MGRYDDILLKFKGSFIIKLTNETISIISIISSLLRFAFHSIKLSLFIVKNYF